MQSTQSPSTNHLLSPVQLGNLSLRNRAVMPPLTRSRADDGDVPGQLVVEYYRQRADAGLIITEGSQISAQGKGYPRTPGIFTPEQIAGWKAVTEAVHKKGGRIFLQLWHVGRLSHSAVQPGRELPVAPSAIPATGEIFTTEGMKPYETPHALTTAEIREIVGDFQRAAENAKAAGFDGVEVHAANGYLIDQFLRSGTNTRTDEYGGSIENRTRFLQEVLDAVIPVFGAERVGVRISPRFNVFSMSDSDPQATFGYVAEALRPYGLAYLHVVELGEESFDFRTLKQRFGGTYIANGGYTSETANAAIHAGDADLVSFGTLFLSNPDLIQRFTAGGPFNAPDSSTFYQGEERGYIDYPTLEQATAL
ncbi:12-oxophytodienoate reductase [Burkholderia sp. lig30]|uniref:alkene reductase n=1 Tax=Burkholderia sp. lig30 TaxID=1192124 RepID=UPI00046207DF|nr:alkene reductase [Burkholderia sp. lig30]KDB08966.1 12-oxophytodienoate reductase [Burkholderia sp. lig30]